jgi:hypothetical protein
LFELVLVKELQHWFLSQEVPVGFGALLSRQVHVESGSLNDKFGVMNEPGKLFSGDLAIKFILDKVNDPESQLNQINKRLILINLLFALE